MVELTQKQLVEFLTDFSISEVKRAQKLVKENPASYGVIVDTTKEWIEAEAVEFLKKKGVKTNYFTSCKSGEPISVNDLMAEEEERENEELV